MLTSLVGELFYCHYGLVWCVSNPIYSFIYGAKTTQNPNYHAIVPAYALFGIAAAAS
jgi:hypothetical protein